VCEWMVVSYAAVTNSDCSPSGKQPWGSLRRQSLVLKKMSASKRGVSVQTSKGVSPFSQRQATSGGSRSPTSPT